MAFLTVNDGKNDYDVTVFPSVYKYASGFIKVGEFSVMTLKKQIRNNREQYILEKIASLKNYNDYCLNNIKIIYIIESKDVLELLQEHKAEDSGVEVVLFQNNNTDKARKFHIGNEQLFVHKFLNKFPGKRIKIEYSKK